MEIKTDAKFLHTVVGTGPFKWARKSRILLTEKVSVLFFDAIWPLFLASIVFAKLDEMSYKKDDAKE